jgi:hypothetical protein
MRGRPIVYARERDGKTHYFFTRSDRRAQQHVPLSWEEFGARVRSYVHEDHSGKIVTRVPKEELEKLVDYERWIGTDSSLKQRDDGALLLTRNGTTSCYRTLTGEEVGRLQPYYQDVIYHSDAKTLVTPPKPAQSRAVG